jgi:DNA-binding NtrC family response regulator
MAKKLLVIDDEPSITKIVERIASELGFEVKTVNDGAAAYDAFVAFAPDILMLDMLMPDIDGIDVLNQILVTDTNVRVVIMSGYGKTYMQLGKAVAAFHSHPNVSTLAKPFRRSELVEMLQPQGAAEGSDQAKSAGG